MATGRPDWEYGSEVNIYKQDISVLSTSDDCTNQRGVDIQAQSASSLVTDDEASNTRDIDIIAQSIGNIGTEDSAVNVRDIDITSQSLSYVAQWGKQGSPMGNEKGDMSELVYSGQSISITGEGLVWGGYVDMSSLVSPGNVDVFCKIDGNIIEEENANNLNGRNITSGAGQIVYIIKYDSGSDRYVIGLTGNLYFESSLEFGFKMTDDASVYYAIKLWNTII